MTQTIYKTTFFAFILFVATLGSFAAVSAKSPPPLTAKEKKYVRAVAENCSGQWQEQPCLATLARVSKHVTSYYAEDLHKKGRKGRLEPLKQGCAASTAAEKMEVPVYAMKGAMTVCANTISDITEATGISPNVNLYQLVIAGVLCLANDPQCPALEGRLQALSQ